MKPLIQQHPEGCDGSGMRYRFPERASDPAASPFGLVFRRTDDACLDSPFPGWKYEPDYLDPPLYLHVGGNSENILEPLCVYMPFAKPPETKNDSGPFVTISHVRVTSPSKPADQHGTGCAHFLGRHRPCPGALGIGVQQRNSPAHVAIGKRGQPAGRVTGQRLYVAAQHLNKNQLAQPRQDTITGASGLPSRSDRHLRRLTRRVTVLIKTTCRLRPGTTTFRPFGNICRGHRYWCFAWGTPSPNCRIAIR